MRDKKILLRPVGDPRWLRFVIAAVKRKPKEFLLTDADDAIFWTGKDWSRDLNKASLFVKTAPARHVAERLRRGHVSSESVRK